VPVIPAKAGIQTREKKWTPAFVWVTAKGEVKQVHEGLGRITEKHWR